MKKKNPVIEQAEKRGYEAGFKVGATFGMEEGKLQTIDFFVSKFKGLELVKGIGPKVFEKFVNHFGPEYFVKIDEGGSSFEKKENKKVDR